jgi:hypothetical protein
METWTLDRIAKQKTYTIGRLSTPQGYLCDTIEDRCIDWSKQKKVKGITAIPEGEYEVVLTMSNRLKRLLPLLLDVPNFEGIRIHALNTAEESLGCIGPGKNTVVGKVTESRKHEKIIIDKIKKAGGKIKLIIK